MGRESTLSGLLETLASVHVEPTLPRSPIAGVGLVDGLLIPNLGNGTGGFLWNGGLGGLASMAETEPNVGTMGEFVLAVPNIPAMGRVLTMVIECPVPAVDGRPFVDSSADECE
ncbi:hypothetical protein FRC19_006806 [Serendipita sp. 401]|nr:hypothetical protein FRC15_006558 [Serendipita sp. 397]KAG8807204.1 hypothetical protein FRC19_006806 [Serendipita sp. 401]KAG9021583.1 hypothetical protein FS842_006538 [Serendipita sp. 407]